MSKVDTVALQDTRFEQSSPRMTPAGRKILSELSIEEYMVVRLLLEEGTNRAIADKMGSSVQTVKHHLLRIFQKVGVDDRLSLAITLIRHGVVACPCGREAGPPAVDLAVSRRTSGN
jgi:DNA-binding NarL/FixJ family response regulator